jgi:hypothetical protein
MAFKEVKAEQGEGGAGEFFKFQAIGDSLEGYFVSVKESTGGQYTKPDDKDYKFLCAGADGKPVMKTLAPPPTDAKRNLAKAGREGKLVPGVKVSLKYISNLDTGQASPMKVIKTLIDVDDAGKPIVKPGVLEAIAKHAAAPPPAKPKADDSLFGGGAGGDDLPF